MKHQVRQRGHALTHGQRLPGAVGIAAPIFGHDGVVISDVCLTAPEQRFDPGNRQLPQLVMACAARITRDIGGMRP